MNIALRHRQIIRRMKVIGVPVVFTFDTATYDPLTDTYSDPTAPVVTGYASELSGDPVVYREMSLTTKEAVTLLFIPDTIDDAPLLDSTVDWAGRPRKVKRAMSVRPDGRGIAYKVVAV